MTSELEPIIPEVSGVGLVSCDLGNHLLMQRKCLCNLHSWSAVLSLTSGQGLFPCCSCFTKKPRTERTNSPHQTNLTRVGSGRQVIFPPGVHFCIKKIVILQHIVVQFNLLESLQCLGH